MSNQRISELTAKGSGLKSLDILEVSEYVSAGVYSTKKINGSQIKGSESVTYTANRTLDITDAFKVILMNKATTGSVTVPSYATVPYEVGTRIIIYTINNDISILESVGGSINSMGGMVKISGTFGRVELYMIGADNWILSGDLTT